ncbi:MAG: hypothetical protein Q9176_003837 [Flavoplaca citrina]
MAMGFPSRLIKKLSSPYLSCPTSHLAKILIILKTLPHVSTARPIIRSDLSMKWGSTMFSQRPVGCFERPLDGPRGKSIRWLFDADQAHLNVASGNTTPEPIDTARDSKIKAQGLQSLHRDKGESSTVEWFSSSKHLRIQGEARRYAKSGVGANIVAVLCSAAAVVDLSVEIPDNCRFSRWLERKSQSLTCCQETEH